MKRIVGGPGSSGTQFDPYLADLFLEFLVAIKTATKNDDEK